MISDNDTHTNGNKPPHDADEEYQEDVLNILKDVDGRPVALKLVILRDAKVRMYYNQDFTDEISWFEFDLDSSRLNFVLNDGQSRDFGAQIKPELNNLMHNAHMVYLIKLDPDTGFVVNEQIYPIILHRND